MGTMEYIQPYSLLLITGFLLVVLGIILFRQRPRPQVVVAFLTVVVALVAVYFYIRPIQTPLIGDAAHVKAMIGQGKPVLLEFQSPYCIGCTALRPAVDQAEKQYAGKLLIIRINIQDAVGMELKPVYDFHYTPTFIFFDEKGDERWRVIGTFDAAKLQQEMSKRSN